jgi:hypothetical protein
VTARREAYVSPWLDPVTFEDANRILRCIGPYVGRRCRELDPTALELAAAYRRFYVGMDGAHLARRTDLVLAVQAFMWLHPNAIRLIPERKFREQAQRRLLCGVDFSLLVEGGDSD